MAEERLHVRVVRRPSFGRRRLLVLLPPVLARPGSPRASRASWRRAPRARRGLGHHGAAEPAFAGLRARADAAAAQLEQGAEGERRADRYQRARRDVRGDVEPPARDLNRRPSSPRCSTRTPARPRSGDPDPTWAPWPPLPSAGTAACRCSRRRTRWRPTSADWP